MTSIEITFLILALLLMSSFLIHGQITGRIYPFGQKPLTDRKKKARETREAEIREAEIIARILPIAWKAGMDELCRRKFEEGRQSALKTKE